MGRLSQRSTAALALVGFVTIQSTQGHAAFPERPIKVIVPFPAGGAVDLIARLVTTRITQSEPVHGFPPVV